MSNNKINIPRGTRDFGPAQMAKRNFIFDTIKSTFQRFGFLPLETPSMENLSTLTGKYGEEGDQLLFKILNSGDYLKDIDASDPLLDYKKLLPSISEKGLRYDLTVPFARYVVTHQHEIALPFKRYQIQPVWRADRPQKGRYREFFQCDADFVGTDSLICEAEIVQMIDEIFGKLGIEEYQTKLNHRKVLAGLAKIAGGEGLEQTFFIALDKLDKIGEDKVVEILLKEGFDSSKVLGVFKMLKSIDSQNQLESLRSEFNKLSIDTKGIDELEDVFSHLTHLNNTHSSATVDFTLARGLSYYTGTILEVTLNDKSIGSLSGGGRYDDLTGVFGLPGLSGVGFSLGVDRIYDVMEARGLFPKQNPETTKVMIATTDTDFLNLGLKLLAEIREDGINSEIYPEATKLKKQFSYADKKGIRYVIIIGSEEVETGKMTIKDLQSGNQQQLETSKLSAYIKSEI